MTATLRLALAWLAFLAIHLAPIACSLHVNGVPTTPADFSLRIP